jgi:cytochrome d ubiquinol oxidase subunit I
MALHSTLACYCAVGFAAAAVYAVAMLRGRRDDYHRAGLRVAMIVATVAAIVQPISGDLIAKFVHKTQPTKLAAMESHFETRAYAPMVIGGWPDVENRRVDYAIEIPGMLSFLATGDPAATITGLNDIPRDLWPNVPIVHAAFQIMVGLGMLMMFVGIAWAVAARLRRDAAPRRWLLWLIALCGPVGFIALEAGWFVTEVGRQPWVIQGILKTADSVTPSRHVWSMLIAFAALYATLGAVTVALLRYLARKTTA